VYITQRHQLLPAVSRQIVSIAGSHAPEFMTAAPQSPVSGVMTVAADPFSTMIAWVSTGGPGGGLFFGVQAEAKAVAATATPASETSVCRDGCRFIQGSFDR
jgi:hypothetical protein